MLRFVLSCAGQSRFGQRVTDSPSSRTVSAPQTGPRREVLGEGGHNLLWDGEQQHLVLHRPDRPTEAFRFDEGGDDIWDSDISYYSQGHANQIHHLIDSIPADSPPRYDGSDGVRAVRCTLAGARVPRRVAQHGELDPADYQASFEAAGVARDLVHPVADAVAVIDPSLITTSLGMRSMARWVEFMLASHSPMPVVLPSISRSPQIQSSTSERARWLRMRSHSARV